MDDARDDFDGTEVAKKAGDEFIVVAGDINDARSFAPGAEKLLDYVIVGLRPVDAATERPNINEIADDVERLEFVGTEEMQEGVRAAAAGAEMHVGDPAGAVLFHEAE